MNYLKIGNAIFTPYSDTFGYRSDNWNFVNLKYSESLRFNEMVDRGLIGKLGIDLGSIGHVF